MKSAKPLSFLTAYLSGLTLLELHLAAIRKYHPDAEIIISAVDDSARKLVEKYRGRYFIDNLEQLPAVAALLSRASHDVIVINDHDTVLFNNVNFLADKLAKFDVVGIEERLKHPTKDRWFRYAPGYTGLSFFMFSRAKARIRIPNWPKFFDLEFDNPHNQNNEPHYYICELLTKHYYLRPYSTEKYGLGNLLKDGDKNILWHQWFGSWEKRGAFISERDREDNPYRNMAELRAAEARFIQDYPQLDFRRAKPAF